MDTFHREETGELFTPLIAPKLVVPDTLPAGVCRYIRFTESTWPSLLRHVAHWIEVENAKGHFYHQIVLEDGYDTGDYIATVYQEHDVDEATVQPKE